jgi:hypothetical protein
MPAGLCAIRSLVDDWHHDLRDSPHTPTYHPRRLRGVATRARSGFVAQVNTLGPQTMACAATSTLSLGKTFDVR